MKKLFAIFAVAAVMASCTNGDADTKPATDTAKAATQDTAKPAAQDTAKPAAAPSKDTAKPAAPAKDTAAKK